jgi:nucleoside 2-deoxyribosyltransferase
MKIQSKRRQSISPHKRPTSRVRRSYTVYFAGDLWNHKDLIGNAILAEYIEKRSKGLYRCIVPQDLEQTDNRAVAIRNQDLKQVMSCDVALFNFDGHELDSGTVVEFMFAKFLDIPSVLLRTDFRSAGDANKDGDPWNLMLASWPRAKVLKLHGMVEYQKASLAAKKNLNGTIQGLYRMMADTIIENLNAVRTSPGVVAGSDILRVYQRALETPGAGFGELFSPDELAKIVEGKRAKGMF